MTLMDPKSLYRVRDDWSQSVGKLNISNFIYRDRNRNGHYDGNDRPMAGIAVVMSADGTPVAVERSNTSGWANFAMSTANAEAAIRHPGPRSFTVATPKGWLVTSGNHTQSADFRVLEGSVAGLSLDDSLTNVGLAPELAICGQLISLCSVAVHGTNGALSTECSEASGGLGFRAPVCAGTFEACAGAVSRCVVVSDIPVNVGLMDPHREISNAREVIKIGFDAVTQADICKIPDGYCGFEWTNLAAVKTAYYQGEGYVNGSVAGSYVAYNSSGLPAEIKNSDPFSFIECAVSAAWLDAEGETLIVEAWREEQILARDSITLSALGAVCYQPRLAGVTRLRFATTHHWQFVLDCLTVARGSQT